MAQWEGWHHTAYGPMGRLGHGPNGKAGATQPNLSHPLHDCVSDNAALITRTTLQVPQFPGQVNTGIIMTVSVVCVSVKWPESERTFIAPLAATFIPIIVANTNCLSFCGPPG